MRPVVFNNFGSLNQNQAPDINHSVKFFFSLANFMVASFSRFVKTVGDIEYLNAYQWFKIKFCVFLKKKLKIGSAVLQILAINNEKTTCFENFFSFFKFFHI